MDVTYKISKPRILSGDEREAIAEACQRPIVFDEDCPESTPEMLEEFRKVALKRDLNKEKRLI